MSDSECRPQKKIRQACDACHSKKIRCFRGVDTGQHACEKCLADGVDCTFSPALKTGRPKKNQIKQPGGATSGVPRTTATLLPGEGIAAALGLSTASNIGFSSIFSEAPQGACAFEGFDLSVLESDGSITNGCELERWTFKLETQTLILGQFEHLSNIQQQLLRLRNQLSSSLGEALELSQRLIDTVVSLVQQGTQYHHRNPMLDGISDETTVMMLLSPTMFVLELFGDILKLHPPPSSKGRNSATSTPSSSASEATTGNLLPPNFEPATVNPALLGQFPLDGNILPQIASVSVMRNLWAEGPQDPMAQYLLVTMLEYHLDRLRHVIDGALLAIPRLDVTKGGQGLSAMMMHQFKEKVGSLHSDASRIASEMKLAGLG